MLANRQLGRWRRQQKSIPIFSSALNSWKVRSINGFEKYLFPTIRTSAQYMPKYRLNTKIDPARFIYPRDAMGDMLHRKTFTVTPFYLPKYDLIRTQSPVWTIKNKYHSKQIVHHLGPMSYDSINDRSQLPCRSGWTQIGRRPLEIQLGLTIPFYDTRKYKEVGRSCSKHTVLIGRRTPRRKHPRVMKERSPEKTIVKNKVATDKAESVDSPVVESIIKRE